MRMNGLINPYANTTEYNIKVRYIRLLLYTKLGHPLVQFGQKSRNCRGIHNSL